MSLDDGTSGRLVLRLFGPPRIELGGEPLTIGRRKAIALLAYLAVTRQSHRRDSLVNLLWPHLDSTRGRSALRRTLHALKGALTGAFLEVDRQEVGLDHGADIWVDVHDFRHQLAGCDAHGHPASQVCPDCVPPLTEAVALARGDFMAGFGLKDSFNFDDWQVFQAEALRRELGDALDRLVRWHSSGRKFEAAVRFARRRLALDPLDEDAHRQLMRLSAWSGRRSAALSQYEQCVAVLKDQLGVPPQEATSELYRAIKDGHPPPPPIDDGAQPAEQHPPRLSERPVQPPAFLEEEVPREEPLFVARERELAQLEALLGLALEGRGHVAFVTGEAGSGKTALVQEFSRRAQDDHRELLSTTGNCNAYTGIGDPYLPFREILELLTGEVQARWAAGAMSGDHARRLWSALPFAARALVESGPDLIDTFLPRGPLLERATTCAKLAGGAEWATRLDELVDRKPPAPDMQSAQQSHLFEQYTRVLQSLAEQGPLLLVLDDLQWADLGSISLLFHLGRHLAGSRILIVGAYRPEEVASGKSGPSAGSGQAPSRRDEAAQASSGQAPSRRETAAPGMPGPRLRKPHSEQPRQRERHPLEPVVNELQRVFGDIIVDVDQAKRATFVDAVLDSEPNRLGRPFREMLHRKTRGHPLFTIELLRGMQERGDLVRDDEGCWSEGPALDWDTLPARVEAAIAERVGRLARPLRAALRVASVEGEDFTAEVVARVLAVDERDMIPLLSSELDRRHRLVRAQLIERVGSRRISRYRFANFLFQKYLYDSLDQVERAYLHEDVGNALEGLYGGHASETAAIAPQLARHFQEAGITEKAIHYLHMAGDRAVQLSAYREATAHLARGLSLLETLPGSLQRSRQELGLQISLGTANMAGYRAIPEVDKAYTRALELCQQTGQTSELCRIVGQLATVHYVRAELPRARELGEEALNLAQQAEDPLLVALCHWRLGFVLFALGEFTAARAHLEQMIAFYGPQHHYPLVSLSGTDGGSSALAYDAGCLWCLGYPDQALAKSREALAMARELDHPFSLADALCFGGCLLASLRRDGQALRDHSEELVRLVNTSGMETWLPAAIWYRGEALAMQGQVNEGIAQMSEGLAAGRTEDVRLNAPGILLTLAQAQAKADQPEVGLSTLAEALVLVKTTGERLWEAETCRAQAELLLMQGDKVGAEAGYHKAIEVARRQSARSWELRATTSLARLWHAQGRTEEARQVLGEVYDWFTEGFDTPDLQLARALLEELQ